MINPCAVKGLPIFLETAARMPEVEFGVVPGWGTTSQDRHALEQLANVRFLPNARNIDEVLSRTRVLLMPSLWYEGFGLIVMEAMLRGIPVVSSDSGGLVEAKHGTGYVIPVNTIERYEPVFDEHAMPRPVVRKNNVLPWVAALRELLGDRAAYQRESRSSRAAAARFVAGLDAAAMEHYLASLRARARGARGARLHRIAVPRKTRTVAGAPAQAEGDGMTGLEQGQAKACPTAMRILLAHYPPHGGGEALAARGRVCRVVARISVFGAQWQERYLDSLAERGGARLHRIAVSRKTRTAVGAACASGRRRNDGARSRAS